MKKPDKKKILKALKILFGVLVVVFLAWYFWKNWDEFSDKIMNVDMGIFIFSMLFYFLYKITLASLWHYITKLNGCALVIYFFVAFPVEAFAAWYQRRSRCGLYPQCRA